MGGLVGLCAAREGLRGDTVGTVGAVCAAMGGSWPIARGRLALAPALAMAAEASVDGMVTTPAGCAQVSTSGPRWAQVGVPQTGRVWVTM